MKTIPDGMTVDELIEAYEKEVQERKQLAELIGWVWDVTEDYVSNPKAGLMAIRILLKKEGRNNGK